MMGRSKFSQFIHRGKLKKIILKTAAGFENEMVSKVCLQRQNMPHNATFHQDLHFLLRQKLLYICYYFYLDFYLRRFSESRSSSGSTPSVRLFVRTSVCLSSTLLGCLVCVICNSQQFSFLYVQTLPNDCSYIEDVHLLLCAHLINIFSFFTGVELRHFFHR